VGAAANAGVRSFRSTGFGKDKNMKQARVIVFVLLIVLGAVASASISGCEVVGSSGGVICRRVARETRGCDQIEGCRCLHKSWGGLGSCDSCECEECLAR